MKKLKSDNEWLQDQEQAMRDNAVGIGRFYEDIKELSKEAANDAMRGIIQYLEEKIGEDNKNQVNQNTLLIERLKYNQDNYDKGFITTQEFENNKKLIT